MGFDSISFASKLHACLGDTCYCKPGNENSVCWTEGDKARLLDALKQIADLEKGMSEKTGLIRDVTDFCDRESI